MKTINPPRYSLFSGHLALINAENPIQYAVPESALVAIGRENGYVRLERRAAALLSELMDEIGGWDSIVPVSGWRSLREQQGIWDASMAEHGETFTRQYVALPNCSEHQTGLAIDLGLKTEGAIDFIRPDFPYSGVCQAFRERAAQYGFIQRYPGTKAHITGIAHEPWHFRFVGIPHAALIAEMDIALEEYHTFLKSFPLGDQPLQYDMHGRCFDIFYVPAGAVRSLPKAEDGFPYMLSEDNMDGFVMTVLKNQ